MQVSSVTCDELYGGRTEAMRLHYNAREAEPIYNVDANSLYRYICKYFKFPVDYPVIHVGDACKEREACLRKEGLMKCSIVPPERLYHTVLPFRGNLNLTFSLYRTFDLTSNRGQCCQKIDEERALTDTRIIDELRLAVQKWYRILEIHEVYEYNVTKYDTETREGGLFAVYIDTI